MGGYGGRLIKEEANTLLLMLLVLIASKVRDKLTLEAQYLAEPEQHVITQFLDFRSAVLKHFIERLAPRRSSFQPIAGCLDDIGI